MARYPTNPVPEKDVDGNGGGPNATQRNARQQKQPMEQSIETNNEIPARCSIGPPKTETPMARRKQKRLSVTRTSFHATPQEGKIKPASHHMT
mmetsp:Transcript_3938/g.8866  ORF Transcript_3938/g.8866 Transcript_3938/m.8866 type:complete len:93 (-) Transcript_3938:7-285(-)